MGSHPVSQQSNASTSTTEVGTVTTITTTVTIKRAPDGTTTTSTKFSNVTAPWTPEPSTAQPADGSESAVAGHPIWYDTSLPVVSVIGPDYKGEKHDSMFMVM